MQTARASIFEAVVDHPSFWRLDGATRTLLVLPGIDERARAVAGSPAGVDLPPGTLARTGGGVPRLAYLGPMLAPLDDVDALLALQDVALPANTLDAPEPLTLCPEASHGHAASPGLAGHRDGCRFAHRWTLARADASTDGVLAFALVDADTALELVLHLALDAETDVLSARSVLRNVGDDDYTVDWLASATLPLPTAHDELLLQHGRWGGEFREVRQPVGVARTDVTNLRGRTSHDHVPFVVSGVPGFGNEAGDALAAHLAWSGNFSFRVERASDGTAALQAGPLPLPGEVRLAPGESFETPALHVVTGDGLNACTHRFHAHARRRVLPAYTRTERPIHANSWEALYFDHDLDALLALIDAAAALGAERFVLDDGWFGRRRSDTAGLGDWFVDPDVYPDGLAPVVERVRSHGMRFGLWFEPEMVNPDSAMYEEHPEWALHLDGVDTPLSRHQLALDIARRDVQDHLVERIVSLVTEHGVDYVKWDMNRDLVLAGDGRRARSVVQPPALYRMLERVREACPDLEIETCASGGGRADFGVLARTGRVWTSDNIDPISRARIQAGFCRFLPPEIMGAHVGHERAHVTGRSTGLHVRAIVALQGQFGFELDARRLDARETLLLRHYTELYRTHRAWLGEAVYHRLDANADALVASALVADDGRVALVTVVAVDAHPRTRPGHLRLPCLDGPGRWRVSLESSNADELRPFDHRLPDWLESSVETTGELLARVGLPLPVMPPQAALLAACRRIGAPEAVHGDGGDAPPRRPAGAAAAPRAVGGRDDADGAGEERVA